MDALSLAQKLIQCPSITPAEGGALTLLESWLTELDFVCTRLDAGGVCNLHARRGTQGPHIGFAGHTDVVPLGEETAWTVPPFDGHVQDNKLWGRGAADMKTAIACFITSLHTTLKTSLPKGSISLIITGDEEGPAQHGTRHMLTWMVENDHIPDLCLIGEPASAEEPGDQIKIGRRGSVTGTLTCHGSQGHIAYPHLANNPIPRLTATLQALDQLPLDHGTDHFQPSHLEITTVDVGNTATNIIPQNATAKFGVRFNTHHTGDSLSQLLKKTCAHHAGEHTLNLRVNSDAFLNDDQRGIGVVSQAIATVTGTPPQLSTRGGTSDGRFLIKHCPVIEVGMTEKTMHQIDEHVPLDHVKQLELIYTQILGDFFRA